MLCQPAGIEGGGLGMRFEDALSLTIPQAMLLLHRSPKREFIEADVDDIIEAYKRDPMRQQAAKEAIERAKRSLFE